MFIVVAPLLPAPRCGTVLGYCTRAESIITADITP